MCWSWDGTKVYYTSQRDADGSRGGRNIWYVNVSDTSTQFLLEPPYDYDHMAISRMETYCVLQTKFFVEDSFYWRNLYMYTFDPWNIYGTIHSSVEVNPNPRFSYESENILFYADTGGIYELDLDIWITQLFTDMLPQRKFSPGPSLFAVADTIYNLNSGEKTVMEVGDLSITASNWNPANPAELVLMSTEKTQLHIYNIETKVLRNLNLRRAKGQYFSNAQFSPDGSAVAFTSNKWWRYNHDEVWMFKFAQ